MSRSRSSERRVQMMGRDGAVVTCLWTQSQTYRGTPETASGRMTLVFRRTGSAWKAVHLHTSTDAPDPQRIPQSEQTTTSRSRHQNLRLNPEALHMDRLCAPQRDTCNCTFRKETRDGLDESIKRNFAAILGRAR